MPLPGGDTNISVLCSDQPLLSAEAEARTIFQQQLILAVDYCHRVGVAHRDINLENMLLQGNKISPLLCSNRPLVSAGG